MTGQVTVELFIIGNELLIGEIQDTNTHWLCRELHRVGGTVTRVTLLRDELDVIADELQAALLRVKLKVLDAWNARRVELAGMYLEALKDTPLVLPFVPPRMEPAWHLFVVRCEQRDALQASLREHGVETLIHYPIPPHLQPAYRELGYGPGSFPITEQIHREALSLPMGPHLTSGEVERVSEAIHAFFAGSK